MKGLAFRRPDGGIALVWPTQWLLARHRDPQGAVDERKVLASLTRRGLPPDATEVTEIEAAAVPGERGFRDAWTLAPGREGPGREKPGLLVDMPRARAIQLARIRAARDRALAGLDLDYLRADETGDAAEKGRVVARKQELRDLPERLDLAAAETPEQLAAIWPALLEPVRRA